MLKDIDRALLGGLSEPSVVAASGSDHAFTPVPNAFIRYMSPRISGLATKAYLSLSMMVCGFAPSEVGSVIDRLAFLTGMGRASVVEALDELTRVGLVVQRPRYLRDSGVPGDWRWAAEGEYKLETAPGLVLVTDPSAIGALAGQAPTAAVVHGGHTETAAASEPAVAGPTPEGDGNDEEKAIEIQALITMNFRVAQELLVTIGNREMRQLELWLRRYGYGPDMVRQILSHCVSKGKRDIGYATVVAREWHKEGLRTPGDVAAYLERYEEERGRYARIRKLMGRHDGLTQAEKELFDIWTAGWGFSEEMVATACKATTKARTPSFDYVNSVLEAWRASGITTVEAAQADLDRLKNTRQAGGRQHNRGSQPPQGTGARNGGNSVRKAEDVRYYADFARMEEELLDSGDPEGSGA